MFRGKKEAKRYKIWHEKLRDREMGEARFLGWADGEEAMLRCGKALPYLRIVIEDECLSVEANSPRVVALFLGLLCRRYSLSAQIN